ncbi:MAG: hypothetical protein MZV63_48135 [Marinilabiliales bacterium]|nr:hypothetical protein [Marinilabiliales bacterium]
MAILTAKENDDLAAMKFLLVKIGFGHEDIGVIHPLIVLPPVVELIATGILSLRFFSSGLAVMECMAITFEAFCMALSMSEKLALADSAEEYSNTGINAL